MSATSSLRRFVAVPLLVLYYLLFLSIFVVDWLGRELAGESEWDAAMPPDVD